jgi:AsmA-like C-terminal region
MATDARRRFWRLCRIYFRRFRISIWVVTLILLGSLMYLNRVGLPDFVKRPLVNKLREQGVALEFARLQLHWSEGFVAHDVSFGSMQKPAAPQLLAEQVQIKLHLLSLLRARLQVDSLGLSGGRLQWIPVNSNAPLRSLTVDNIEARLRLLPGDQWRLDDLHARFAGVDILVSASITNATAIRDWEALKGRDAPAESPWPERLQRLSDRLESISFASPPELRLVFEGDARNVQSFSARLNLNAAQATTPWGQAEALSFSSRLFAAASNELSRVEIALEAASAQTRWANTTNLNLQLRLLSLATHPDRVDAALTLRANAAETPWATVGQTQIKAHWVHAVTNPIPQSGRVEFDTDLAVTRWARAARVQFSGNLTRATNRIAPDATLAGWTNLLPYQIEWSAGAGALRASGLDASDIACAGQWDAPRLAITRLHANLYRGTLDATGDVDVGTRTLAFDAASDFDVKQLAVLLMAKTPDWLAKFSVAEQPRLRGAGTLTLPAWTNRAPDWSAEVRPTLQLAGEVALTNLAFQGIAANWLHAHVTCTNQLWRVPDLTLGRPEGLLRLEPTVNERTGDYRARIYSSLDLTAARPLLDAGALAGLELCRFTVPPVIEGELWGRSNDLERLGFQGRVALTNFTFREFNTDAVVTGLHYTNRVLACIEPRLWRGTQTLTAAGITADFNTARIYFTNGFSTVDPGPLTHAIGPVVEAAMAPYHFIEAPTVRFAGYVPLNDPNDVDMRFDGRAGRFASLKFKVPRISTHVHWFTNTLTITNVQADFYEGTGQGWARFVFPKEPGALFTFSVNTTNTNLRLLMADLTAQTNDLDGRFNLELVITDANTVDMKSWNGFGHVQLRDGLIWDIPIFGVLSKPLDVIVPGIGHSRVAKASANFGITGSVVQSDDLEMRAPTMRLQYRGTADFDGIVKARVVAEPLRDTPILGPIMNVALWPVAKLFEYKITGTLAEPKLAPVYIPKILLLPLNPLRVLEELFAPNPAPPKAPPEIKPALPP